MSVDTQCRSPHDLTQKASDESGAVQVVGGVDCFMDFPTEAEAGSFAKKLLATYPHLMKFGLMG